jgi:aspartyl-tRNA(Asn)/glutamyl-tRNA(Gln) amidotransferase subunit A
MASSINCGFTADGRPIGLQISGQQVADLETLQLTVWREGARPVDARPVLLG